MSAAGEAAGEATVLLLRRCLLLLAALGVVGTGVELAMLRHWKSPSQLIPWATLAVVAVGVVALAGPRPGAGLVRAVRVAAFAICLSAALGVFQHVHGNYEAGPLDAVYGERWDTMSEPSRWWAAATESVGPSPPLAPAVLAQAAFCLWFATLRHPATRRSP